MKKLLQLIGVVGGVSIGGVIYVVGQPAKGVTMEMLRDAGIAELCTPRVADCSILMTPEAVKYARASGLVDGGFNGYYLQTLTAVYECVIDDPSSIELDGVKTLVAAKPDGKAKKANLIVFPPFPDAGRKGAFEVNLEACTIVACKDHPEVCGKPDKKDPFQPIPFPCAWKVFDGGSCIFLDGGDPGVENTYPATSLVGPGCLRKSCGEIAGVTSDPSPLRKATK